MLKLVSKPLFITSKIRGEFVRFLTIGFLAFAADFGTYELFLRYMNIGIEASVPGYMLKHSLSSGLGCLISFTLNRIWVFKSEGRLTGQVVKYFLLAGANLIISNALIFLMLQKLSLGAHISKLGVICFMTVWNFTFYKVFVYNDTVSKLLSRLPSGRN
ncbi:MAG: GtrA family protein [Chitinispirillaceae bacterium]